MLSSKFFNKSIEYFRLESMLYILLYLFLFFVNPTIALLTSAVFLFTTSQASKKQYYTFYILLACWLGVLNMTKQLFSDQIYYAKIFVNVDTTDFWSAVWNYRGKDFLSFKEIIFNFYSVICNIITGGNPRAYFFILTVNVYLLHFLAIHKVFVSSKKTKFELMCAIFLMAFFYQFFLQSIHAVRQILATSFVIYAIAYRAVEGKNNWFFLLIAFFIHNTSLFYIVLAFLPYIYTKLNIKQVLLFLVSFLFFLFAYVQIGHLLNVLDMGALSSVGRRLITAKDSMEEALFSYRNFLIYSVPTVLVSFIILFREYKCEKPAPLISFAYISILTFLLILGFVGAPTVQFRFGFYIYSFIPFILLFPGKSTSIIQNLYCFFSMLFFVLRFFLVDNDWRNFASWDEILTNTFYQFLTTPYYSI